MRFSFGQELRQEQKQILTQRMILAMEILQLPLMELEERIELEMEKNPLLELVERNEETAESGETGELDIRGDIPPEPADESGTFKFEVEREIAIGESPHSQDDFRTADEFAANYTDTIDEAPARSQNWLEDEMERQTDRFANIASPSQTLQDYLIGQLGWYDLSDELRSMVERMIYNLTPNGFLTDSLDVLLGPNATTEERQLAEQAIQFIKTLEPAGVGARDVRDCLLLQLSPEMPCFEILYHLIADHLEDLERNRLPHITRKTGYSIGDIQEALLELRKLNPRPGAGFSQTPTVPIIPDVVVETDEQGNYFVRMEEGNVPRLRISNYYRKLLEQKETDKGTRDYIKQKVGSAQWLIDSIKQRQSTLRKVANAIVEHQTEFLERGPGAIRPLKMQQIADKVGVHVTTVSRACDEKWMLTPQGLFPLKRFFSGSVQGTDGEEDASQDTVCQKLKELIETEDKSKPLSDEELMKLLDQSGFKVARRTIVKYRQMMRIPSSRERRCWDQG
ncbi:MAG: RNA polymerase factor sigma-54 [Thermoguttaceae bacterium]